MAPSAQDHRRSHSLLLLQKLLNLRDSSSPLTLILDSLEQSAGPLIQEFITRAKLGRSTVVYISFATVKKPHNADIFIKARGKPLKSLAAEIASHCPLPQGVINPKELANSQKYLLIIDTLNPLVSSGENTHLLEAFLSGIISPVAPLVAVYHEDVPIIRARSEYAPHPLTQLTHLSTAIFRISSLYEAVEAKRAQSRSLPAPEFGLREGREGVLIGLKKGNPETTAGIVVEMEMRRRSGRSVVEKFVLIPTTTTVRKSGGAAAAVKALNSNIMLLSDHPLFAAPKDTDGGGGHTEGTGEGDMADTTFNLGLTEKQRKDREGIVLPYFDAQTDIGAGEGGRILYEMGREDDWDDEEDEI
ncbi:Elongator complex protein 5 [Rhypophila decipiens]|uniref:Elongator complex protein 5 n=1 Tax=Rhypophila decipiens TaxID=261697 RepID=A0AAN7B5B2_9PEZI|nr:Elongator complex protein 5 [Rhypophila decipiens]